MTYRYKETDGSRVEALSAILDGLATDNAPLAEAGKASRVLMKATLDGKTLGVFRYRTCCDGVDRYSLYGLKIFFPESYMDRVDTLVSANAKVIGARIVTTDSQTVEITSPIGLQHR